MNNYVEYHLTKWGLQHLQSFERLCDLSSEESVKLMLVDLNRYIQEPKVVSLIKFDYCMDDDKNLVGKVSIEQIWSQYYGQNIEDVIKKQIEWLKDQHNKLGPSTVDESNNNEPTSHSCDLKPNQTVAIIHDSVFLYTNSGSNEIYRSTDSALVNEVYRKCCRLVEAGVEIKESPTVDNDYYVLIPSRGAHYCVRPCFFNQPDQWEIVEKEYFSKTEEIDKEYYLEQVLGLYLWNGTYSHNGWQYIHKSKLNLYMTLDKINERCREVINEYDCGFNEEFEKRVSEFNLKLKCFKEEPKTCINALALSPQGRALQIAFDKALDTLEHKIPAEYHIDNGYIVYHGISGPGEVEYYGKGLTAEPAKVFNEAFKEKEEPSVLTEEEVMDYNSIKGIL